MKTFFAYVGAFFTFGVLVTLAAFVRAVLVPNCWERARRRAEKKAQLQREKAMPRAEVRRP